MAPIQYRYEIWFKLNIPSHKWTQIEDEMGSNYHLAPDANTLFSAFQSDEIAWTPLSGIPYNPTEVDVKIAKRENINASAGPGTRSFQDAETRTYDLKTKKEKKRPSS